MLTCRSLHSVGVWCLDTDFDDPSPRLWSLKIPQQSSCSTWPSPGFTWHLKTFSHLLSPKPYVTDSKWDREKSETKKRRCVQITTAPPPPYIQLSTIWNHFCYVILFATKWGLDFHGLYHIVLCCTRLQSEAGGRGQSEREGVYICLVCGLMAPYVCEEKWQPEVGSERRPTTPPCSRSARHHPSFRFMPQTYLSRLWMLCCPVSLGMFSPSQHTRLTV